MFRRFRARGPGVWYLLRQATMKRNTLLIYCLPLLFSCSSDDKDGGYGPLATPSGFCVAWGDRACNDEVLDVCGASDREACVESQSEYCEKLLPADGYDPRHAESCLAAVRAAYADADLSASELDLTRNLGGACSQLIRGDSEEGDSCEQDFDCDTTEGFECVLRPGGQGTCQQVELVGGGLSCRDPAVECEEDFFCNGNNCVVRLEEDDACEEDGQCGADLRCGTADGAGGAGSVGACVPRGALTDPCQESSECTSQICLLSANSSDGVCVSRVRLSQNEPICAELR